MKNKLSILLAVIAFTGWQTQALAQAAVNLGSASSFAVLGDSAVTNTGVTTINGDLGVSPSATVTGFPPGVINGTMHLADGPAVAAQAALTTAYDFVSGESAGTSLTGLDLGGMTLFAGVYNFTSSAALTGTLTLDGQSDPNARFHFQIVSTLTTAANSLVVLIGGATADNVFWQVGSSATFGTNSQMVGNVLALTSITVNSGATSLGRLLARNGAVTLDTNTVSVPTAVPEPAAVLWLTPLGALGFVLWRRRVSRGQTAA